jgi:hypothetical protein
LTIGLTMAKKKSRAERRRQRAAHRAVADAPPVTRPDWESVEVEFFAREAELYRTIPVETFEDLDKD